MYILSFLCFFPALAAMCQLYLVPISFSSLYSYGCSNYTADLFSACLYSLPYVSFCFADCTATLSSACFNSLPFFLQLWLHTILFNFFFFLSSHSFYVLLSLHIFQVYLLLDSFLFSTSFYCSSCNPALPSACFFSLPYIFFLHNGCTVSGLILCLSFFSHFALLFGLILGFIISCLIFCLFVFSSLF